MDKIAAHTMPLTSRGPAPLKPAPSIRDRAQAEDAAEQFEAVMALQMIRSMQSSLESGNLLGDGMTADVYNGLAEWELARMLARSTDLGIKEEILRQLPKEEDSTK